MLKSLKNHITNLPGWRTRHKIVVFESDDWGSIRSCPKQSHPSFVNSFPDSKNNPYLCYDTLANSDDLNALYNLLSGFKDYRGNYPVFTFNTVVSNPRFDLIKNSGFLEYFYEPFTTTLKRYYPNQNVFQYWRQGIDNGLIMPQFHGREHVNVPIWLKNLRSGDLELLKAFQFNTWSTPIGKDAYTGIKLQAALDWANEQPLDYQKKFIVEGLTLFNDIFGYRSKTMIANNFILDSNLHPLILKNGIHFLQGMKYQVLPFGTRSHHKYVRRKLGVKDYLGMNFLIRNCTFEPSQTKENYDDVGICLRQIQSAFLWGKPAVISTHRLNYIGELDENNRRINLLKLNELLNIITKTWPDVEFLSSPNLSEMIDKTAS